MRRTVRYYQALPSKKVANSKRRIHLWLLHSNLPLQNFELRQSLTNNKSKRKCRHFKCLKSILEVNWFSVDFSASLHLWSFVMERIALICVDFQPLGIFRSQGCNWGWPILIGRPPPIKIAQFLLEDHHWPEEKKSMRYVNNNNHSGSNHCIVSSR